ncbi:MAG: hypothetical protein SGBAC_004403 [Bacillariaceae sp.]
MAPRPEAERCDAPPDLPTAYVDKHDGRGEVLEETFAMELDALEHTLDEFSQLLNKEPPMEPQEPQVIEEEIVESTESEVEESVSNLFAEEENALDDILLQFMELVREDKADEEQMPERHLNVDNDKESSISPSFSVAHYSSQASGPIAGDDENGNGQFTCLDGVADGNCNGFHVLLESSTKPLVTIHPKNEDKNDDYDNYDNCTPPSCDDVYMIGPPRLPQNEAEEPMRMFSSLWQCDAMTPLHSLLETNEATKTNENDSLCSLRRRYKKETASQSVLNIMLFRREPLEIDFPILLQQLEQGEDIASYKEPTENEINHDSHFSCIQYLLKSTPPLLLALSEELESIVQLTRKESMRSEPDVAEDETIKCYKSANEISSKSAREVLETREIMDESVQNKKNGQTGYTPLEDRNDCIHIQSDSSKPNMEEECREGSEIRRNEEHPDQLVYLPSTAASPMEQEFAHCTQFTQSSISEGTSSSTDDDYPTSAQQQPSTIFTKFDLDEEDDDIPPYDDAAEYLASMETPKVRNCNTDDVNPCTAWDDSKSTEFKSVGSNVWGQWPFFSSNDDPEDMVLQPHQPQLEQASGFILQQDTDLSTISGSFSLSEFEPSKFGLPTTSESPYLLRLLHQNDFFTEEAVPEYAWFQTTLKNTQRIDVSSANDECEECQDLDQSWGFGRLETAYDEVTQDNRDDVIGHTRNAADGDCLDDELMQARRVQSPTNSPAIPFSFEKAFETRDTPPNDIVYDNELLHNSSYSVSTFSYGSNFWGDHGGGKKYHAPTAHSSCNSNNNNMVNKILLEHCPSEATEQVSYSSGSILHSMNSMLDASKRLLNQILVGVE